MREALTKRNIHPKSSLSIEETYHPPDDQVEKKHRVDRQGSPEIINFRNLSLLPLGSLLITLQGLYSLPGIAWMRMLTSRNLNGSIWKNKEQYFLHSFWTKTKSDTLLMSISHLPEWRYTSGSQGRWSASGSELSDREPVETKSKLWESPTSMDRNCWWKLLSLGENLNLPGRGQEEGDNIQARRPEKERLVRKYSSRVETAPRSCNTYRLEKWNASSQKLGVDSHNHWPHLEKGILCHGGGVLSSSIMLKACQHKLLT